MNAFLTSKAEVKRMHTTNQCKHLVLREDKRFFSPDVLKPLEGRCYQCGTGYDVCISESISQ